MTDEVKRRGGKGLEILAPAGSREQLVAAVRSGADAVYLGAGVLNARRNAENFSSDEELESAVAYCHESGVKVQLAANILVRDDEWRDAQRLVGTACRLGVDALIIQDLGLARYVHACAPDMPMHASTQLSLHTPHGAMAAAELGFERAVLSRELSRDEIAEITAASPIETEVFVHGALCMSVSGQCLFSSVLGGRSGNRGLCAQPCRLPFRVSGDKGGFDGCMSLKDMSHIDHIPELAALGVTSVKIEGRMKRPEYVAAAVTACRLMRDEGEVPDELREGLASVFSRSGFTDGYFRGARGRDMFGRRTRDDVVSASPSLLKSLHALYRNEYQRVPVSFSLAAKGENAPTTLRAADDEGREVTVEGERPQTAESIQFSEEFGARILSKTGGTPYYLDNFSAEVGEGLAIRSSSLSRMKKQALHELSELRGKGASVEFCGERDKPTRGRGFGKQLPALRAVFRSAEQVPENLSGVEMAYLPLETDSRSLKRAADALAASGVVPAVESPRGLFGRESEAADLARKAYSLGVEDIMLHNVGMLHAVRDIGMRLHGGFGLNVFNSRALDAFAEMGFADSELSYELSLSQIAELRSEQPRGMIIRSRIPMMLARCCPAANSQAGCSGIAKGGGLCGITDRMGREFPVACRFGCSEVLNSVRMSVAENVAGRLKSELSLDWVTMVFCEESRDECERIISAYLKGAPPRERNVTAGLYFKGAL